MDDYERRLRQRLKDLAGIARQDWDTVRGASEAEIVQLERECGLAFPEAYKTFLRVMGAKPGPLLEGTDLAMSRLPHMQSDARRLLRENRVDEGGLDGRLVFALHQGYVFLCLGVSEAPDPVVSRYTEPDRAIETLDLTFTAWLDEAIRAA